MRKTILGWAVILFAALNAVAYHQAVSMTVFSDGGTRTHAPERLGIPEKISVILNGVSLPKPHSRLKLLPPGIERVLVPGRAGLTLSAFRIPTQHPKGAALLFHGYGGESTTLLEEGQVFAQLGFTAFLIDFPGYGNSPGHETSLGYREAEDIAAAVKHFKSEYGKVIVYGESMGAAAALRAAGVLGADPDVLIADAAFPTMRSAVYNRFRLMGLPGFPLADVLLFWGGAAHGFSGSRHNPVDYASHVTVPTLVLQGAKDKHVSVKDGRGIFGRLRGRKALIIFPEGKHGDLLASDPARWQGAVTGFIDGALKPR